MKYQINYQCQECDGFGHIEHQRSETRCTSSPCPECDGEQFKTVYAYYDSPKDCRADYPNATIQEWGGNNDV